jgi:hypothetical protein
MAQQSRPARSLGPGERPNLRPDTTKSVFTTAYYCVASWIFLVLLHVSEHYHLHLRFVVVSLAFFWTVSELVCFAGRSPVGVHGLVVWFAWFSLVSALDVYWILNPAWTGPRVSVCVEIPRTAGAPPSPGAPVLLRWSGLPDDLDQGIVYDGIWENGLIEVCGPDDGPGNSALIHGSVAYMPWMYRLSLLALVGVACKSCMEYHQTGSSRYLYTYILVYGLVTVLVPKPRPPTVGDSWLLPVCSCLYFSLYALSATSITTRTITGAGAGQAEARVAEKEGKVHAEGRIELSRAIQCAWVLFAWEWSMLPIAVGVQSFLYYRILSARPRSRRSRRLAPSDQEGSAEPRSTAGPSDHPGLGNPAGRDKRAARGPGVTTGGVVRG